MENDDKLKAFFKEHAQPLRREVWFSRRVMNRLPGETRPLCVKVVHAP